ncbi:peptide/nickel transport system substrate-binding protein [Rhizobium sp. NFR07]|uniref:ABC transporter substrate-binding protein n=1 Tax=Rhizobium sp. NFR07 TaxID=1566262 RepID=UPI0008E2A566|nr:ABC transporter substrate-binding protein [Rhizobium sp. NFR07]SFA74825.1 peptide/nickel transport system substrate-binding protein [Rhizobium sp. NFR07]
MFKLNRRTFLAGTSAVLVLPALPALAAEYREADGLKEKVSSGALPSAKDRLPVNPLVIKPTENVGTYGGDWNLAIVGGGSLGHLFRYQAYEPLVRYNPDWSGVTLNVAEAFDANEDATQYTIRLRKGMKWSDGAPFTTADIKFWYDTILTDKRVAVTGQGHWKTEGKPAKLEVIDEQTFKVTFAKPNGLFPLQIAWADTDQTTRCPKHYLEQFHIDYNPQADDAAKARGFQSWIAAFQSLSGLQDANTFFLNSSKKPALTAWNFSVAPGENTERAIAERNPFYWKVDTQGNQLPYMDRIVYQVVADPQVLLLKAMQGEIDMMDQYIGTPNNKAVLYDAREQGNFEFYALTSTEANVMTFMLNLNHSDETKRALFRNKDFRVALSLALDRQSLIDAVLVSQGTPGQPSIRADDPLYNEQLATQFIGYDIEKANAMLDAILPERDSQNFRLDARGRRLSIIFEIDQARTAFLDFFQLVIPMYQAVGIDAQMRTMDRSLWETRIRQGRDFDATVHQFGASGGIGAMLDPRYYLPSDSNAFYAPAWSLWYTDPSNPRAEEPPEETKRQFALYDKLKSMGDAAGQQEIMKEIIQGAADNFYVFGVSLPPDGYGIVKNNMKNVSMTMPNSWPWPTPGPTRPEQFYKV